MKLAASSRLRWLVTVALFAFALTAAVQLLERVPVEKRAGATADDLRHEIGVLELLEGQSKPQSASVESTICGSRFGVWRRPMRTRPD